MDSAGCPLGAAAGRSRAPRAWASPCAAWGLGWAEWAGPGLGWAGPGCSRHCRCWQPKRCQRRQQGAGRGGPGTAAAATCPAAACAPAGQAQAWRRRAARMGGGAGKEGERPGAPQTSAPTPQPPTGATSPPSSLWLRAAAPKPKGARARQQPYPARRADRGAAPDRHGCTARAPRPPRTATPLTAPRSRQDVLQAGRQRRAE
jgi:hypothetical protein